MASKRTSHAVYETKYHLVWAPKDRKGMLRGALRERVEGLVREIAQDFGFAIDTLAVAGDHVHIFLDFPPRYSIAKVVGILKSISASQVFEEFPQLRKQLWARELWEDGYFARTVGDKVRAEVIRRYIRQQQGEIGQQRQLKVF
jgi:REP-associated tyrosine transposase